MDQSDTIGKIELFPSIVLSTRVTNWKNDIHKFLQQFSVIKSQQRFQFTLKGVRCEANIGMTIHTLVLISESFSYNCNSIQSLCVNWLQRTSHPFSSLFRHLYISQCKFYAFISFQDHHPLVQHVPLRTTGSSTYEINYWSVHMYIWVCFIQRYSIFNKSKITKQLWPKSFQQSSCFLKLINM